MPEGSWKCVKCNNINYPFRTKCNRQNCGAEKPSESNNSPVVAPTSEEDDQVRCEKCLYYYCTENCCSKQLIFLLIVAHITKLIYGKKYSLSLIDNFSFLFFAKTFLLNYCKCMYMILSTSSIDIQSLSTVPVSTRTSFEGWEGPESSFSIAQYGVWK